MEWIGTLNMSLYGCATYFMKRYFYYLMLFDIYEGLEW